MELCHQCGREITVEDIRWHPVRKGYSLEHFPAIKYEKTPLCSDCLRRQKKVDTGEKIAALLTLGVVLLLMATGVLFLFGFIG